MNNNTGDIVYDYINATTNMMMSGLNIIASSAITTTLSNPPLMNVSELLFKRTDNGVGNWTINAPIGYNFQIGTTISTSIVVAAGASRRFILIGTTYHSV